MAFRLPTLNLTCNIYSGASPAGTWPGARGALRLSAVACQLTYGRRVNVASTGGTGTVGVPLMAMSLLLVKLTDIRGLQDDAASPDWVECPAGSGRFYVVAWVDDIGKGFSNEHRTAAMQASVSGWTAPYP